MCNAPQLYTLCATKLHNMNTQQKLEALNKRANEAIQTAKEQEAQARKAYFCSVIGLKIGKHFELVFPTIKTRKARQRYEKAQENRLTIIRQFAALLEAVPTDYRAINTLKA